MEQAMLTPKLTFQVLTEPCSRQRGVTTRHSRVLSRPGGSAFVCHDGDGNGRSDVAGGGGGGSSSGGAIQSPSPLLWYSVITSHAEVTWKCLSNSRYLLHMPLG